MCSSLPGMLPTRRTCWCLTCLPPATPVSATTQTGCVIIHVQGSVALQAPTAFTESFILAKMPSGQYYIANQVFRLL